MSPGGNQSDREQQQATQRREANAEEEKGPYHIIAKKNVLLRRNEPALPLSDMLVLRSGVRKALAPEKHPRWSRHKERGKKEALPLQGKIAFENLMSATDDEIKYIQQAYGAEGLFRLFRLVTASPNRQQFGFFYSHIREEMALLKASSRSIDIKCDNDRLPQGRDLAKFDSNIISPSLSRKLYYPGMYPGFVVYGLGGPRILVSHPFRGKNGQLYDVWANSLDVWSSLLMRGYRGTFLFLDNLPDLDTKLACVPRWLLWFSLISANSDLVLYLKTSDSNFSDSQMKEIQFTPDRVQKKVVELQPNELTWAENYHDPDGKYAQAIYPTADGRMIGLSIANDEDIAIPRHAPNGVWQECNGLIQNYADASFRKDRLIVTDSSDGNFWVLPLNYPVYDSGGYPSPI
jgi:hypothetical protein